MRAAPYLSSRDLDGHSLPGYFWRLVWMERLQACSSCVRFKLCFQWRQEAIRLPRELKWRGESRTTRNDWNVSPVKFFSVRVWVNLARKPLWAWRCQLCMLECRLRLTADHQAGVSRYACLSTQRPRRVHVTQPQHALWTRSSSGISELGRKVRTRFCAKPQRVLSCRLARTAAKRRGRQRNPTICCLF